MDVVRTVAPDRDQKLTLISLDYFKAHKRISHSAEDEILEDCITDAFDYFDGPEGWLHRPILTQTWEIYADAFGLVTDLPLSPVSSITAVRTRGLDGSWSAVDPTRYELLAPGSAYSRLSTAPGQVWPTPALDARGIQITAVCGWDVDSVPSGIRRAILLLAGSLYEHREADFEDTRVTTVSRKIEFGITQLCGRWRILNNPAAAVGL